VIDLGLLGKNRCFSFSNAAIMIYTTSNLAAIFLFSLYLQYIKGLDARSAGLILLASTLITATLTVYAGRLSDRMNLYSLASMGVIISLAGLLSMTFISSDTPIPLALMEMILISAGGAFFYPPLMKIILGSISKDRYAMGSSLAETMRLIGNSTSMSMVSIGFAIYLGGMDITPDSYPAFLTGMKHVLATFVVLCTASLVMIRMAYRVRPNESAACN
jgi:predicted MFS family arabinose efflux permease